MNRQTASRTHQAIAATPLSALGILQRKCDCGQQTIAGGLCDDCGKNYLSLQRATRNSELDTGDSGGVPSIVHDVLRSPGQQLEGPTRTLFEPRFGRDFSKVRVHVDESSARSARAVNALAYTVGHDVVFGAGQYRPNTTEGQGLLAHELAHVIQQNNNLARKGHLTVGKEDDPAEREADAAAVAILNDQPALVSAQHTSSLVQRQLPTVPTYRVTPTCAHPGFSRSVDLQPVFLRTSAADAAPTGVSWARRLAAANTIWRKIGVTFNARSAITLNTPLKTSDVTSSVRALRSGAGVEVFLVANHLTTPGGADTMPPIGAGCGASGSIVMSDLGASNTLLAHELGHILGLDHPTDRPPYNPGDANTIMEPSGSNASGNPPRNTMVNYNRLLCPAAGGATCLNPDT